jgi:hypothetical protein
MGNQRRYLAAMALATVALAAAVAASAEAQQPQIVDENGIRYQVTRQEVDMPVAVPTTREQQVTSYRQQVTTENVQHQQVYHVPVTQYQVVSRLHNRWNPFAEPYWTHHYEPVTTWQQQVGTVQIPVNKVAWVPETKTVQQQVTTWQTAKRTVEVKTPIGPTPPGPGANTMMASAAPASSTPTASLSPAPAPATQVAANPYGGQKLAAHPPRYPTAPSTSSAWQPPAAAASPAQTATQPSTPAPPQSRY